MEHVFRYDRDTAIVETTAGKVRGFQYDGINIFKGIPYARAKRWHMPEPTEPFEGEFDATSYGYVCKIPTPGKPNNEMLVPHRYWPMSEDCLNLNIWTPGTDDKKRPVMVWIHGGGFRDGSAIEHDAYDGFNSAKYGDMVFVSINHRLNVIGYLDLSAFGEEYADTANLGQEDIIASLKWIRDNIAAFGGDPDNVTLSGQSGGGGKIATLLQMPAADGLFHKAVIMSGLMSTLRPQPLEGTKDLAERMMKELGVSSVKEMEEVPYEPLLAAYTKCVRETEPGKYTGGSPLKNDYFLGFAPKEPFRMESINVPVMTGTVFGESSPFTLIPESREGMTREEEIESLTEVLGQEAVDAVLPLYEKAYPDRHISDLLFLESTRRIAVKNFCRQRAKYSDKVFQWFFDYDFPFNGGCPAWHCADICFFFHNCDINPYTAAPGSRELEKKMFDSMVAFMKTGDPSCEALAWKAVTPDETNTMILDQNTRILSNYDDALLAGVDRYVMPKMNEIIAANRHRMQH